MVMQTMRCLPQFVVALALTLLPSIAQSQTANRDESIIIAGSIERKRVTVTRAELDKLPKHTANIKTNGTESAYEGVALQSVLELVGVKFGKALRGDRLLGFIVVEGAPPPINAPVSHSDDSRAVFALPELDPTFKDHPVLLVTGRDGKPLAAPEGPFRIIAPEDKARSRWIRDVRLIWVLHADYLLSPGIE